MKLFFADLPVYRILEDEYYKQREDYVDYYMYGDTEESRRQWEAFYNRDEAHRVQTLDRLEKAYGGPWRFNEVIGYVRMHFLGNQVRGELWKVDARRIVRTRKKLILYRGHKVVSEVMVPDNASSDDIWRGVMEYVARARKELSPRYVDSSMLEVLGEHTDWRALMDQTQAPHADAAPTRPAATSKDC